MCETIFEKIKRKEVLSKEDAVALLNIENLSEDYYKLLKLSNDLSKEAFGNKGYIFLQIGIDDSPCPGNCKFCSMAVRYCEGAKYKRKTIDEVLETLSFQDFTHIDSLFLMTMADYEISDMCKMGKAVKAAIPEHVRLVANCGDFTAEEGRALKAAGFDCAYHLVRLRESIDTDLTVEQRIATMDAIKAAGMDLYYCIEPIGREHTYEEIAEEMIRARNYEVDVMAVMSRVPVPGTVYEQVPEVDEIEMAKIVAVTRIVTNPKRSMNVHEPKMIPMIAGVNQLYAEIGSNPRDNNRNTETGRGFNVERVKNMLNMAGYEV